MNKGKLVIEEREKEICLEGWIKITRTRGRDRKREKGQDRQSVICKGERK